MFIALAMLQCCIGLTECLVWDGKKKNTSTCGVVSFVSCSITSTLNLSFLAFSMLFFIFGAFLFFNLSKIYQHTSTVHGELVLLGLDLDNNLVQSISV